MTDFQMKPFGCLMEPEPGNPHEVEGVTNPAAVRGPDGKLYLFPRLIAQGNYSRIGIAVVKFDQAGDPVGAERIGIALEPTEQYEKRPGGLGGCEDPRVSFVEPLGHYVMTYVAFGEHGPRIALAVSEDLLHWNRIGLASFEPYHDIKFQGVDDKDSAVFPQSVPDRNGRPALALLHRPLFPGTRPEEKLKAEAPSPEHAARESIWIAYRDIAPKSSDAYQLSRFTSHHDLACPIAPWEIIKIGIGAPPVLCHLGWLLIYHGVCEAPPNPLYGRRFQYSAGVMILAEKDPTQVLYRSTQPVLKPDPPKTDGGKLANVVFPTGIDQRVDLGTPNRFDVYYGMADDRIGVARLDIPETLPANGGSKSE